MEITSSPRQMPCVALIADMVESRSLTRSQRPRIQRQFSELVEGLNRKYSSELLSRFVITLGDEFQGLLHRSAQIPAMIWDIEQEFSSRIIRVGFGFGVLHTPVPEIAINVDGPVLHNARAAIIQAKKQERLGGVFVGFPKTDEVLNGLAGILWFHRSRWTPQQRRIVNMLQKELSQSDLAEKLGVSRQAISKHVRSAGWLPYQEGERAFQVVLRRFVDPLLGVGQHGGAD